MRRSTYSRPLPALLTLHKHSPFHPPTLLLMRHSVMSATPRLQNHPLHAEDGGEGLDGAERLDGGRGWMHLRQRHALAPNRTEPSKAILCWLTLGRNRVSIESIQKRYITSMTTRAMQAGLNTRPETIIPKPSNSKLRKQRHTQTPKAQIIQRRRPASFSIVRKQHQS